MDGLPGHASPPLRDSYGHRDIEHDDLLLALACDCWAGEHAAGAVAVA